MLRMIGQNYRMTEITAAIAREQVKKGREIIRQRNFWARLLINNLEITPGYQVKPVTKTNACYVLPIRVDASVRDQMVKGLQERGVPVRAGYGGPLYNLPAFKPYARECPNCERIEKELIIMQMYSHFLDEEIIDQITEAFIGVSDAVIR